MIVSVFSVRLLPVRLMFHVYCTVALTRVVVEGKAAPPVHETVGTILAPGVRV
jgi:hypothetical protein